MATTQFIGPRQAPLWADPVEWNNTRTYEPYTFVTHNGDSYASRQNVPIGIDIVNDDYWVKVSDYNAQAKAMQESVNATLTEVNESFDTFETQMNQTVSGVANQVDAAKNHADAASNSATNAAASATAAKTSEDNAKASETAAAASATNATASATSAANSETAAANSAKAAAANTDTAIIAGFYTGITLTQVGSTSTYSAHLTVQLPSGMFSNPPVFLAQIVNSSDADYWISAYPTSTDTFSVYIYGNAAATNAVMAYIIVEHKTVDNFLIAPA